MQTVLIFVGGLGGWEILLIILVLLLFFGAKKIPDLAKGLGKGLREFKDATNEIRNDIELNDESKKNHKASTSDRSSNDAHTRSTETPMKKEEAVTEQALSGRS